MPIDAPDREDVEETAGEAGDAAAGEARDRATEEAMRHAPDAVGDAAGAAGGLADAASSVPSAGDVPDTPSVDDVPGTDAVPDTPSVDDVPGTDAVPDTPSMDDAPGADAVPDTPSTPEDVAAPPESPAAADAPSAPTPSAEVTPEAEPAPTMARTARTGVEIVGLGDSLNVVDYSFATHDGPDAEWIVQRVQITEIICRPYEIMVDLATEETSVDTDALLGSSCELNILRDPLARPIHGIAHRVDYLGATEDRTVVRIHVVPALAMLEQGSDSRIFQDEGVVAVISAVLDEALQPYERSYRFATTATYQPRDYCTQYRETDLAFVQRLCEEEGISYYFEQEEDKEVVVFVDRNEDFVDVETLDGSIEIPVIEMARDQADLESIKSLDWSLTLGPTSVLQREYDWQDPENVLEHEVRGQDERSRDREIYEHGRRRWIRNDGDLQTRYKMEASNVGRQTARGESNVTHLGAGGVFELVEHGRDDLDGVRYLVTRVEHVGECPEALLGGTSDRRGSAEERYRNVFECIRLDTPFRPIASTPKPMVYGPQTARVTGPGTEEIHTDEHGRIKVKFHWDRVWPDDDTCSCWVRVAQAWGGAGWGSLFIPRIDMEVIVEFLEGNPDRPLVTGCVYNGQNGLPYELPADKTKSTIKSNSTPGGDGFNEFRFDDDAGNEEIFLHAQKDFNEQVGNDHSTNVSANQSNTVGADQTESVSGDQTMTVSQNRTKTVEGNESITVQGSQNVTIQGAQASGGVTGGSLDITGDYQVETSNTVHVKAPTSLTLEVGGSKIVMEPGKIQIVAGGGSKIELDTNAVMEAQTGGKFELTSDALIQSAGRSKVQLDANAMMQSSAQSQLQLDANATMKSNANVSIEGGANAAMKTMAGATCSLAATNAKLSAPAMASLESGASMIQAMPAVITVMGTMVKIN